ncbi:hypothetical protein BC827DRAFT_497937 [Russula dissimulans]|nr:hypothetical protein BC827DRAFT_497937 [Russula dissimulans]
MIASGWRCKGPSSSPKKRTRSHLRCMHVKESARAGRAGWASSAASHHLRYLLRTGGKQKNAVSPTWRSAAERNKNTQNRTHTHTWCGSSITVGQQRSQSVSSAVVSATRYYERWTGRCPFPFGLRRSVDFDLEARYSKSAKQASWRRRFLLLLPLPERSGEAGLCSVN